MFKKVIIVAVFIFLSILKYFSFAGEKVVNNGFGYDGVIYKSIVTSQIDSLRHGHTHPFNAGIIGLAKYYTVRMGHPLIIRSILSLIRYKFTDKNILIVNYVLGMLLFLMSYLYLWLRYLPRLCFSMAKQILFIVSIYFIFPVVKYSGFYPFLQDEHAIYLSIILYVTYIEREFLIFFIIAIISSITFPPLFFECVFLIFFAHTKVDILRKTKCTNLLPFLFPVISLIPVIIFVILIRRHQLWYGLDWVSSNKDFPNIAFKSIHWSLLSLFFLGVYLSWVLRLFTKFKLNFTSDIFTIIKNNLLIRFFMFASLIVFQSIWSNYWSTDSNMGLWSWDMFFWNWTRFNAVAPGFFLVANFWHYGPYLFIFLFNIQSVREIINVRVVDIFIVCFFLIYGTFTESRFVVSFYPLFLMVIFHNFKNLNISSSVIFLALFITSRLYLNLNEFPFEFGPSIEPKFFPIMYTITIIFLVVLYIMMRGRTFPRESNKLY